MRWFLRVRAWVFWTFIYPVFKGDLADARYFRGAV